MVGLLTCSAASVQQHCISKCPPDIDSGEGMPSPYPYGSEGALLFCKRVMETLPYAVPDRQDEFALWVDIWHWHNDVKYDRYRPLQHFTRYHAFKECLSIAAKPTASLTSISLGGEMFDVPHVELVQRKRPDAKVNLFTSNLTRLVLVAGPGQGCSHPSCIPRRTAPRAACCSVLQFR
ncbi:hypothetical protein DL89DRAFT_165570 [Linderina pennispora]|uniref:Uncharacterized protein n=1 Tax=Linderina pennispora TaxID=61395 RepID=A0A1Y1W8A8_9FUNG|nr:uncharacterized protein DL89DRAFT_165570 [Linderina pennispora]ORX69757.1 hypothetical protein DL89DRAFT_165570 [Linderina pennispora]